MKKNTQQSDKARQQPPDAAEAQTVAAPPPESARQQSADAQPEAVQSESVQSEPTQSEPTELQALRDQLAQRTDELSQARDSLLRAQAESQNVQRAAQRDIANAHKYGSEALAATLLPGMDSLEHALASPEQTTGEVLREGIRMTLNNLEKALAAAGIKPYSSIGEAFDPSLHLASAIMPAPATDQGKESAKTAKTQSSQSGRQQVLEVLQRGWMIGERVLRPATVVISAPHGDSTEDKKPITAGGTEQ